MDAAAMAIQSAQMAINTAASAAEILNENAMQDKQNAYNLDMWNKQNEYNSPQAQMQRFIDAGLNPNLIYSQGNNGNNASTPQKNAPDFSKGIDRLAKAFNIENLMLMDAQRRTAEENARLTQLKRYDAEDMRTAQTDFGRLYNYNPKTGRYEWSNYDVEVQGKNPRGHRPGDSPTNEYWFNHQFMNSEKNWLNPFREGLLSGQTGLIPYRQALMRTQRNFLAPQVQMQNYNSRYYPFTFWIGNGTKLFNSLSSGIPSLFY